MDGDRNTNIDGQLGTLQALRQCVDALCGWMDQPETDQALDAARDRAARAAAIAAAVVGAVPAQDGRGGRSAPGDPGDPVEALRSCAAALDGWLGEFTSAAEYDSAFDRVLVAIARARRVLADAESVAA